MRFLRSTRRSGSLMLTMLLLAGLAAVPSQPVSAQECGTVVTQNQIQMEQRLRARGVRYTQMDAQAGNYEVPLAIHIVRRTDGTGGFRPGQLDTAMADLNAQFAQVGWTFYVYGDVDYIDDDFYYFNTNTFTIFNQLKQENVVPFACNVYFAPNTGYCGVSSFTTSSVQGILMDNACAGIPGNNSTFAHEVGHYFDLYHTHETAFGVECPDGGNCSIAGDLLCDTPADPTLTGNVLSNCTYDNSEATPGGCSGAYAPQVDNLMSYSLKYCRDLFTADQIAKMNFTIETNRPELSFGIGGVAVIPATVEDLGVGIGGIVDTVVYVKNTEAGNSFMVTGATTSTAFFSVSSAMPDAMINGVDSAMYTVTFDATALGDNCDLGVYEDTLVITTGSVDRPEIRVPLSATVTFEPTTFATNTMATTCLTFTAGNTPGFGHQSTDAFVRSGVNGLYDGSLLLGVVDGSDTTVYQDVYSVESFPAVENINSAVLPDGHETRSFRFATSDRKLLGNVTYNFDPSDAGQCRYIIAEYSVWNECAGTLVVRPGLFGDFDIFNSGANWGGFDAANQLSYVASDYSTQSELENSTYVCGFGLLDGSLQNLRALPNPVFVYPTGRLESGQLYNQLAQTVNDDATGTGFTDWSSLLSVAPDTLGAGDTLRFAVALLYSTGGTNGLAGGYESALGYYQSLGSCCVGTVGNVDNDPEDRTDISDLTALIGYLFLGGVAPECEDEANVDGIGIVDVGDLSALINHLFLGGSIVDCP